MRLHRRNPGGPDKLHSKLWLEEIIARVSNWVLKKVGEPQVFSIMPDQEPRYWRELVQYIRNIPIRISGKVPPVPLREVAHRDLHPYHTGTLTRKVEYDACYLDPPPTIVVTEEQFSIELEQFEKIAKEWHENQQKESDDASRQ